MGGIPGLGTIPSVGSVPGLRSVPSLGRVPSVGSVPGLRSVPSLGAGPVRMAVVPGIRALRRGLGIGRQDSDRPFLPFLVRLAVRHFQQAAQTGPAAPVLAVVLAATPLAAGAPGGGSVLPGSGRPHSGNGGSGTNGTGSGRSGRPGRGPVLTWLRCAPLLFLGRGRRTGRRGLGRCA